METAQIVASGLVCPIGDNAQMASIAMESSFSSVNETPFLDKRLNPIKMATVPDDAIISLPDDISRKVPYTWHQRLLCLGTSALNKLIASTRGLPPLPLFLALPEKLPKYRVPLNWNIPAQLASLSKLPIDVENSRSISSGRAAGLEVLNLAIQYFKANQDSDYVVVGGVDSYWDPNLITRLDADNRLLTAGSSDGTILGESACMLLIARGDIDCTALGPPLSVGPASISSEPGHRYSNQPNLGAGLDNSVKQALAHTQGVKIDTVWTSHLFDQFSTKEFGVMATRNQRAFSDQCEFIHPVDAFGDIGSAFGPTLLSIIHTQSTNTKGRYHLVCCSSDLAPRGALVCFT